MQPSDDPLNELNIGKLMTWDQEGGRAFMDEVPRDANPYPQGTLAYATWLEGWDNMERGMEYYAQFNE